MLYVRYRATSSSPSRLNLRVLSLQSTVVVQLKGFTPCGGRKLHTLGVDTGCSALASPRGCAVRLLGGEVLPQIGVLTHPIAIATDIDEVAVVQDAVDERRRHDVVAEHLAPLLEALVGSQHG